MTDEMLERLAEHDTDRAVDDYLEWLAGDYSASEQRRFKTAIGDAESRLTNTQRLAMLLRLFLWRAVTRAHVAAREEST